MPEGATQEELRAYHYLLSKKTQDLAAKVQAMEAERRALDERRCLADISSQRTAELSSTHGGRSTGRTPQQPRHATRLNRVNEDSRSEMTRSLDLSFMSLNDCGNVIPKTPAAAILAATTYLQVTQPPEDDPRAEQHRQTILGLGMVGAALGPRTPRRPAAATAPRREESPRNLEIASPDRKSVV